MGVSDVSKVDVQINHVTPENDQKIDTVKLIMKFDKKTTTSMKVNNMPTRHKSGNKDRH